MQAVERSGGTASGIEIDMVRATAAQCECADAMHPDAVWPTADVILMNPPFSLWQQFTERALTKGTLAVVVLLRLGALAGQKRRGWWRAASGHLGITVHVLSKRPSFTGKGTDGADYAWVELSRDKKRSGVTWV